MNKISWLIILLIITGCVSTQTNRRIATELKTSDFNSLASNFMFRPTSVEYIQYNNDDEYLIVKSSLFGTDSSALFFGKRFSDDYINAIEKYMEWHGTAIARRDMITREISTIDSGMSDLQYKFSLHSGNESNHYLMVETCTLFCMSELTQYYDFDNASTLSELIKKFRDGVLTPLDDLSEVYN